MNQRSRKTGQIGKDTAVVGVFFGSTGSRTATALLSAVAGVRVSSTTGLSASDTLTSRAAIVSLFGVDEAVSTLRQARNHSSTSFDEFDFDYSHGRCVIQEHEIKEVLERKRIVISTARHAAKEAVEQNPRLMETTD